MWFWFGFCFQSLILWRFDLPILVSFFRIHSGVPPIRGLVFVHHLFTDIFKLVLWIASIEHIFFCKNRRLFSVNSVGHLLQFPTGLSAVSNFYVNFVTSFSLHHVWIVTHLLVISFNQTVLFFKRYPSCVKQHTCEVSFSWLGSVSFVFRVTLTCVCTHTLNKLCSILYLTNSKLWLPDFFV